jgi:ABC-type sugar transport system substrate-binding protein
MLKNWCVVGLSSVMVLLTGCSIDTAGLAASGANVIPQNGSVAQISELVHTTMKGKKIGWVPAALDIALTRAWTTWLKRGFDQLGAQLVVRDAGWDFSKMPSIADSLINAKVDALILHNPDVGVLTSQIQRARSNGIYVITFNMMPSEQSDAFVGGDFQAMGAALARRVVGDCQARGKTKVAAIDGFGTDGASVASRAGWDSVFKNSGVQVVSRQSGNFQPDAANSVARTVLQQHPDLCAFIGNHDLMMQGVSSAIDGAGKKGQVAVYTIDASEPSCANIKAGTLTAAVSYVVPAMGVTAVSLVQSLLESGTAPGSQRSVIFMPYQIIDKDNVDDAAMACYSGQ